MSSEALTRRSLLTAAGSVATASLTANAMGGYHMESDPEIRVALVGCGGRGSGAALNALAAKPGPQKLVAMADVFADRLDSSYKNIMQSEQAAQVDVPAERKFIGFDAYKHAMDELRPGDVVILTTPPAFRWVHYTYAISKGLNVFMEKPVTVDGPTSRRMLALNKLAQSKNLKVGVGLMSRHARNLQELAKRIQHGDIGDILCMRGYRMHGPAGASHSHPKPANMNELEYQIRRFHSFLWASGGCYNDFYIHIVDHLMWMKNAVPVAARASGGKHYKFDDKGIFVDQNFDSYSVEYTFADGTKFFFDGRCVDGAQGIYSSYIHGTKGCAVASRANDCGGPSAIYKGQTFDDTKRKWQSTDTTNPYQNEWDALMLAIRNDTPHNEVDRGVTASLVSSMGRMAAHTGQEVSFDAMLNSDHEFAPDVDKLVLGGAAPLPFSSEGLVPIPQPGKLGLREY